MMSLILKLVCGASHHNTSKRDFDFVGYTASTFLNGFLYWVFSCSDIGILALHVKEVFSYIKLAIGVDTHPTRLFLGSLDGLLCMTNKVDSTKFDMWSMKEHTCRGLVVYEVCGKFSFTL